MNTVAQTYTELSLEGVSPVGLVVALYDNALRSLHRARRAIEANDIEQRIKHLNHVQNIIAHLQGTLDLENGGEVAKTMMRFYNYARGKVLEASLSNSKEKVTELAAHFSTLREAWQMVDAQVYNGPNSPSGHA